MLLLNITCAEFADLLPRGEHHIITKVNSIKEENTTWMSSLIEIGDTVEAIEVLKNSLECCVCINLICEPITLPCGHSFCRTCLVRSLSRSKKKCPTCRGVCHLVAQDHPESVMIAQLARTFFPHLYEERLLDVGAEKASWQKHYPIFYYNLPMFPGELLALHLFEPRYKLMMKRIIDSTRRFAYVPNYDDYVGKPGDIALIAEIKECEFQSDGRCLIESRLTSRCVIVEHYIEDGTQGLHHCVLEDFCDDPVRPENMIEVAALLNTAIHMTSYLMQSMMSKVIRTHGPVPCTAEAVGLWLVGVMPLPRSEKHALLASRDTLNRLRKGVALLTPLVDDVKKRDAGGGGSDSQDIDRPRESMLQSSSDGFDHSGTDSGEGDEEDDLM